MKNIKALRLSITVICVIAFINVGCKKEIITTKIVEQTAPSNSQPIVVYFDRTYSIKGCNKNRGICISMFAERNSWEEYKLLSEEAKGEAWAEKVDGTGTRIKYYLSEHNLSPEQYEKMVVQKKFTFDEDTYVPTELIDQTCKSAGISEVPSEMKIPAGDYPVEVIGTPNLNKTITITVKIEKVKDSIKITITIKFTP